MAGGRRASEVDVRKVWFALILVTGLVAAACKGPTGPDMPMDPNDTMHARSPAAAR